MPKKLPILSPFLVRPRLIFSILTGVVVFFFLPTTWELTTRLLVSWNILTAIYLILAAFMMNKATPEKIKRHAAGQDEGQCLILTLNIIAAFASVAAILLELSSAKNMPKHIELQHILLTALTICLSWAFMHMIFALHYAHEYYSDDNGASQKGLDFPGKEKPDYWDFVYFSFIIGTAAQTADISITSRTIRRTATVHCVAAFFFNTTILALMINIGAGLL